MSSHQIQTFAPVRIWVRFRPIFRLFQPLREQARLPVKMDGMESNYINTFFVSSAPNLPTSFNSRNSMDMLGQEFHAFEVESLDRTAHVKPCEVQQRWPGISMTQFHIIGSDLSDRCSQTFFLPGCYVEETSQQYLRGSAGERWDMSRQMGLSRNEAYSTNGFGVYPLFGLV